VTRDNWKGGVQVAEAFDPEAVLPQVRAEEPMHMAPLNIESAEDAYQSVLTHAGAVWPRRDPVDRRIIETVRTGKVTYEPGNGIITCVEQVGGYPTYEGRPYADADKDGMPDEWEKKYGLNPHDPADAGRDASGDGYTNIEAFIHGFDPTRRVQWAPPSNVANQIRGLAHHMP